MFSVLFSVFVFVCVFTLTLYFYLYCIVVLFSGGVSVTPLPGEEATISQPRGGGDVWTLEMFLTIVV